MCKEEMMEGVKIRGRVSNVSMFLCHQCVDLITAVAHDAAYTIFEDITHVMGSTDGTWKEELESWCVEEKPMEVEAK